MEELRVKKWITKLPRVGIQRQLRKQKVIFFDEPMEDCGEIGTENVLKVWKPIFKGRLEVEISKFSRREHHLRACTYF